MQDERIIKIVYINAEVAMKIKLVPVGRNVYVHGALH